MKAIFGAIACGKTNKVIQEVLRNDGILVIETYAREDMLVRSYPKLKGRICSYQSAKEFVKGKKNPIYIDQVDGFLWRLLGREVAGVTFTFPELPDDKSSIVELGRWEKI